MRFDKKSFPNLHAGNHRDEKGAAKGYNCIAWDAGFDDIIWDHAEGNDPDERYYWPSNAPAITKPPRLSWLSNRLVSRFALTDRLKWVSRKSPSMRAVELLCRTRPGGTILLCVAAPRRGAGSRVRVCSRPSVRRDPIYLARLQPIAAVVDWKKQRRLWRQTDGRTPVIGG